MLNEYGRFTKTTGPQPSPAEILASLEQAQYPEQDLLVLLEMIVRSLAQTGLSKPAAPPLSPPTNHHDAHGQAAGRPSDNKPIFEKNLDNEAIFEGMANAVYTERRHLALLLRTVVTEPLTHLLSQSMMNEQTFRHDLDVRTAFSQLSNLARQALERTRELQTSLYPTILETLGLVPALEVLVNHEVRSYGLPVALTFDPIEQRLPHSIESAIFQVTQDTLFCAIHQAQASQISIRLQYRNDQLSFIWTDNGLLVTGQHMLPATRDCIEQLGGMVETRFGPKHGFGMTINFVLDIPPALTQREMDVLQRVSKGMTNKEIAHTLSISPRTVNFHLNNIYSKLNVASRTEAALYASRCGWVH